MGRDSAGELIRGQHIADKDLAFAPDAARARALDQRVRRAFADSLRHLFASCEGVLLWHPRDAADLLDAVACRPVAPGLFAVHAELVEALFAEDFACAQQRIDLMLRADLRRPVAPRMVTLCDADLGEHMAEIHRRAIDEDPASRMALCALPAGERARMARLLEEAQSLLRHAAPSLAGELAALAHEILMTGTGPGARGFGGATTFYLWGAVALNAAALESRVDLAVALAHEGAHAFLFGATQGAPLVSNDPAERYASPLRADPRPMEGLVHAGFVLARMIWCQDALLESTALSQSERRAVAAEQRRNLARFKTGAREIAAHARLTAAGDLLWSAACGWIATRRRPAPRLDYQVSMGEFSYHAEFAA